MITIIAVLVGLLLPAIQAAREAARRSSCSNNVRQIGLALQTYHDVKKGFPPGARLHDIPNQTSISWRVLILPYLEETTLYEQIQPTTDGGAIDWAGKVVPIPPFLCPTAEPPTTELKPAHYSGVMGVGRDDSRMNLTNANCGDVFTDGMLYPGSRTRIPKIEDGTSHTLAVGERSYYIIWNWMDGATANASGGISATRICSNAVSNVSFPMNSDSNEFGYVGDTTSANRIVPLNDLYFGSGHTGGAQFCLADGCVRFISDSIDFTAFGDMVTIAGGEPGAPQY